jgi:hypothetical protein
MSDLVVHQAMQSFSQRFQRERAVQRSPKLVHKEIWFIPLIVIWYADTVQRWKNLKNPREPASGARSVRSPSAKGFVFRNGTNFQVLPSLFEVSKPYGIATRTDPCAKRGASLISQQ